MERRCTELARNSVHLARLPETQKQDQEAGKERRKSPGFKPRREHGKEKLGKDPPPTTDDLRPMPVLDEATLGISRPFFFREIGFF